MLTIGVDAHKRIHFALALDETGAVLDHWSGPNSPSGWQSLLHWAQALASSRRWGIEGAWNYGRGLAHYLVAAGETTYEINPRWTAQRRGKARRSGKNDRLDAQAVAQLVREEAETLPLVAADDRTALLDLLVTERESALAEATRLRNQIHQLLLQVDPEYQDHLPTLKTRAGLDAVETFTTTSTNALEQARTAAIRGTAERLRLALKQADELGKQIRQQAQAHYQPLTEICGINLLTAGALAGILRPGKRFASDAQLAAHAGVAPLEVSSAGRFRHRLNRGGNRRLNAILYRIALTQARCLPAAQEYLQRRQAEGKTRREVIRALKRYLVRAIWRQWQQCLKKHQDTSTTPKTAFPASSTECVERCPVAQSVLSRSVKAA